MVTMVESNGITLHYRDNGNPTSPVMVLINPLGADCRSWDACIDLLQDEYRLISYDKRGHGLSQSTPFPYRIEDHAKDLIGLLNALNIPEAIFCGVSVGGMIALAVASEKPRLAKALILCNSAVKMGTHDLWNQRIEQTQQQGLPTMVDNLMVRWFSDAYRRDHPTMMVAWRAMVTGTSAEGYAGTCAALRDADLTELAKTLSAPTCCFCGSEDVGTPPEVVEKTAYLIPDAEFKTLQGVGHFSHIEKPDSLVEGIKGFVKEKDIE